MKRALCAAAVLAAASALAGGGWVKYPGNPVMGSPELGTCFVSPDPLRDVRVVSDAPGPPAYDVREVVLAN